MNAIKKAAQGVCAYLRNQISHSAEIDADEEEIVAAIIKRKLEQEPCEWVSEDMDTSIWLTGCGEEFWFGDPPEGINYCPNCGHPAKIKAAEEAK